MSDLALVAGGAVLAVAYDTDDAVAFGEDPQGEVVSFDSERPIVGMLWDGAALTTPEPPPEPDPPPPVDHHAELVAAGFTSEQADAILALI